LFCQFRCLRVFRRAGGKISGLRIQIAAKGVKDFVKKCSPAFGLFDSSSLKAGSDPRRYPSKLRILGSSAARVSASSIAYSIMVFR
jgi:hypothetical protein